MWWGTKIKGKKEGLLFLRFLRWVEKEAGFLLFGIIVEIIF